MLNSEAWPDDTEVYVFSGRAFEELGSIMFAGAWSGDERCAFAPSVLLARQELASETQLDNAFTYLGLARPDLLMENLKPRSFFAELFSNSKRPLFTDEEWSIARRASIELFQAREPSFRRGSAVHRVITDGCRTGDLIAAVRPITGGPFKTLPTVAWSTGELDGRFWTLQTILENPATTQSDEPGYGWLFIEKKGLERVLATTNVAKLKKVHLSPYVRAIIAVLRELKVSPDNQPMKAELAFQLQQKLRKLKPPLPVYLANNMATIMREPESQRRRGRPAGTVNLPPKLGRKSLTTSNT